MPWCRMAGFEKYYCYCFELCKEQPQCKKKKSANLCLTMINNPLKRFQHPKIRYTVVNRQQKYQVTNILGVIVVPLSTFPENFIIRIICSYAFVIPLTKKRRLSQNLLGKGDNNNVQ